MRPRQLFRRDLMFCLVVSVIGLDIATTRSELDQDIMLVSEAP
jgi:hypothetical protein